MNRWHAVDDHTHLWDCDVCGQLAASSGPWCDLYCEEKGIECMFRSYQRMKRADSEGDGPLVNAIVWDMRKRYGQNGTWW